MTRARFAALALGCAASGAAAQQPPPPAPPQAMEFRGPDGKPLPPEVQAQLRERFRNAPLPPRPARTDGEVVVAGQRPRGSVASDIPPERTFSPLDIRAYGANSLDELLTALGPQVGSGRGRSDDGPILLLNGRRISGPAEIARIPPEAVERMEVFPEELALRYGYRADQKVVNVVTFQRYDARLGIAGLSGPTDGTRATATGSAGLLRIRGDTRTGLDVDYSRSGALRESERDLVQPAGAPDLGGFRTLLPAADRLSLAGTLAGPVAGDALGSLAVRLESSGTHARLGRVGGTVLERDTETRTGHIGTAINGRRGTWQWTLTANYDRSVADTRTDRGTALGDSARSRATLADADLVLAGPVATLPSGPVVASIRGGVAFRDLDARARIGGTPLASDLSRDRGGVQASVDVPIVRDALSANVNAGIDRLSDAGTLRTIGGGIVASPLAGLDLLASVTQEEGAPTIEQLGAPRLATPGSRTFDFVRRETVDLLRITGGNAALRSDDRRVVSLGLTARPGKGTDLTITADYLDTRIDDPIAAFPVATPALEAAFPDRFVRDPAGRLAAIDARPVNFARSRSRELRWGINFLRPLGALPAHLRSARTFFASSEAEAQRRLPPGAIMTRVEGSRAVTDTISSRLVLGLQHRWRLEDRIVTRPGGPVLDLLGGDALDSRGGRPRHEVEVQAGAFRSGLGARLTANWTAATRVDGAAAGDLRFGALTTVNLSLFANVGDRLGRAAAPGWARGMRLTLGLANLFDARPDVRDASGRVPLAYQPAYLNPLGRTASVTLRKAL